MQDNSALGRAMGLVRDLRERCPWDRAQTRTTLRPYLVEEALELDDALAGGDPAEIREELADLLLNVAFQLVIGEELGEYSAAEVADLLEDKMKRRHPQLFDLGPPRPWEHSKAGEGKQGVLAGLPRAMPPLLASEKLQSRAAAVGFDWPDASGPAAKVREELAEVESVLADPESGRDRLSDEIGDLFFAVVNLSRKIAVPASQALEGANRKFRTRFESLERLAAERGMDLAASDLAELDLLWEEVKRVPASSREAHG